MRNLNYTNKLTLVAIGAAIVIGVILWLVFK